MASLSGEATASGDEVTIVSSSIDAVFRDRYGLHPRAALRIQETARGYHATITLEDLTQGGAAVGTASMISLVSAAIRTGDRVRVTADGEDAEEAAAAIAGLLEAGVCHPS